MNYLISVLLLLSAPLMAQADDSFEVVKDGKTYLCRVKGNDNPGAPLNCANKAYRGPFTREQAQTLCRGAINDAPADCGIKAYRRAFNKDQSVQLCKGTEDMGPQECGEMAYRGPFSKEQSVRLCHLGSTANAQCAIDAYRGPYTKEEAIGICKAGSDHPMLMISRPKAKTVL